MNRRLANLACAVSTLLGACATASAPPCTAGERISVSEWIYFGTAKPHGVVSAEEWSDFVGSVIGPRFPQGLSVWPAAGQWRSADGSLTRENSFVLNLVHAPGEEAESSVQAIVSEYKSRFEQEAVLRVRAHVCVSF